MTGEGARHRARIPRRSCRPGKPASAGEPGKPPKPGVSPVPRTPSRPSPRPRARCARRDRLAYRADPTRAEQPDAPPDSPARLVSHPDRTPACQRVQAPMSASRLIPDTAKGAFPTRECPLYERQHIGRALTSARPHPAGEPPPRRRGKCQLRPVRVFRVAHRDHVRHAARYLNAGTAVVAVRALPPRSAGQVHRGHPAPP